MAKNTFLKNLIYQKTARNKQKLKSHSLIDSLDSRLNALGNLVSASEDQIILFTSDLKILFVNKSFEKAFNIKFTQVLGKSLKDINYLQATDLVQLEKKLKKALTSGKSNKTELELVSGKETKSLEYIISPIFINSQVQYILTIARDFTHRKKLELDLEGAKEQLEIILDNIADGVTVYDRNGDIVYTNDVSWRLLAFPSKEKMLKMKNIKKIAEKHLSKFEILDEYGDPFYVYSIPTLRALHGELKPQSIVYLNDHLNKKGIWLLSKSRLVYDELGNLRLIVNILDDITEQKELEKRKDEFIGIVSHELKTPLTSIKAFTQVLNKRVKSLSDPQLQKEFNLLATQVDRFSGLVLELLDTTKIQSGGVVLNKEKFNFANFLLDLVHEFSKISKTPKILVDRNDKVMIIADKNRISQVVTNLLSNAIKYALQSKKIIIKSELTVKNALLVSIQDFGPGITLSEQKKVFDRFYQVKKNRLNNDPSLGIGLYISSQIIKRHGGEMWVKSDGKTGSTFYFTLPIKH